MSGNFNYSFPKMKRWNASEIKKETGRNRLFESGITVGRLIIATGQSDGDNPGRGIILVFLYRDEAQFGVKLSRI